jgi:hypothetical protein
MATMSDMRSGANTALRRFGHWVVGLYAWTTAVYFGFVWLDVTYARMVVEPGAAFHTVSDVLLATGAGMVLLGMVAVVLAAHSPAAMKLLMASVILALLMFPAPMLLSGVLRGAASTLGAPIRILLTVCISGLAFLGFGRFQRYGK